MMIDSTLLNKELTPNFKIKTIALPVEHGSWGFLFEPIVIGLLIAPTIAGLFLSFAAIGAFLTRFPLKLWVMDLKRGRVSARTKAVRKLVLIYGITALLFFSLTIKTSGTTFLIPLLIASPLAAWQLIADFKNKSRNLFAELSGATALASVTACLTIIDGWTLTKSFAIWLILITRIVPSILYVRAKIKIIHGQKVQKFPVILLHVAGLLIVGLFAWKSISPMLVIIAIFILLIRAIHGLSIYSKTKTAKAVGIKEVIYGTLTAAALAIGYTFNL